MKNENDPNEISPQESLHERLCAYVLGEGTSEERIEIERELLRSPELRAQCDTIERTIGLVQTAMAGSESLSPEAAETLVSAASASRPAPWQPRVLRGTPWLRIAAGIGAVALGFAIVRSSQNASVIDQRAGDAEVAKLDGDESNAKALKRMEGIGYGGHEKPKQAGENGTYRGVGDEVPPSAAPEAAGSIEKKESAPAEVAITGARAAEPNKAQAPADSLVRYDLYSQQDAKEADAATRPLPEAQIPVRDQAGMQELKGQYQLDPSLQTITPRPITDFKDGKASDSDSFYLGQGTPAGSTAAPAPGQRGANAPSPASERQLGRVAGPQDGVADKGKKRAVELAVGAGPSTPGPGGAATPSGPATGGPSGPGTAGGRWNEVNQRKAVSFGFDGAAPREEVAKLEELVRRRDELERGYAKNPSGSALADNEELVQLGKEIATREALEFADDDDGRAEVQYYWHLSPAEQQSYLDRRCRRILDGCRRWPNEVPRDMFFRFWGDNPFEVAALDRLSTFSADVDTASYALARRYLNEGHIPEKSQIRTEEFVNYFKSDVPAPTNGVFAIRTDLTQSRFSSDTTRQMMRVVVRGKDLSKVERQPLHLTFVVDVSGSMREQNRLEMVKHAMRLLVSQLEPYDQIGIVKFSSDASVVLRLTPCNQRATIESAIEPLAPEGSTNSNAGLQLGYGIALAGLDSNSISRVVFLSDGVANVGETDPAKIAEQVKPMREKGIYLNTIGVGMNNHNDVLLEQLADKADGMCSYIDSPDEAKRQLVDNFTGAFQPIARDVKIQVEFDPSQVLRYRLLGYENRAIADADFRNDKVDAGELGAGHQVTALYEVERQSAAGVDAPLATVRVRWKEPRNFGKNIEQDAATEIAQTVMAGQAKTFEEAGQSYRKVVIAAQFAEILRRSVHARGDSLDGLLVEALRLQKEIPGDADFNELCLLISKSKDLIVRTMPACDELCQAIDQVREASYRRAQLEQLQKDMDAKTLDELKKQNDILEARLRDLVKRRLENQAK